MTTTATGTTTRPRAWRAAPLLLLAILALCTVGAAWHASAARALGAPQAKLAVESAQLTASDGAANAFFGCSVAISGDTAIVGAATFPGGAFPGGGADAAYIFVRSGGVWTQQAKLADPGANANDWFGASVAIDDDVAFVGAPNAGPEDGAVWGFTRSGTAWTAFGPLQDPTSSGYFGWALAVSGGTLLAGEPGIGGLGRAEVWTGSGDAWSPQANLYPDSGLDTAFGSAVAISGDTALVGAPDETAGTGTGSVYEFTRTGVSWAKTAKFSSPAANGGSFGQSLALSGSTLLVGSPGNNGYTGAAYLFSGAAHVWTNTDTFTPTGVGGQFLFGWSVALNSDTAVVGAPAGVSWLFISRQPGSAYTWKYDGTNWNYKKKLQAGTPTDYDCFGSGVALGGSTEALVGSMGQTVDANTHQGAVYVEDVAQQYTITPSVVGTPAHGTISPATEQTVDKDATPEFTFAPATGYKVKEVKVDGVAVALTGTDSYTFPAVTADHTISVEFAVKQYAITPSVVGTPAHGTISPATVQTLAHGSTPTFTFTPDATYRIDKVLVDGSAVTLTGEGTYTFPPLDADHTISVSFAPLSGPAPVTTVSGTVKGWSRHPVTLRFTAVPGSGGWPVAYTEYRVGDGAWTHGTQVRVTREGVTRVSYRSADTLGQVEVAEAVAVHIDTQRPRVEAQDAAGAGGGVVRMRYRVVDPVPGSGSALVRLKVVGADGRVLTRSSTVPAPVNDWRSVRISTRSLAPGVYTVVLRAVDAAGNFQRGVTRTTMTVR